MMLNFTTRKQIFFNQEVTNQGNSNNHSGVKTILSSLLKRLLAFLIVTFSTIGFSLSAFGQADASWNYISSTGNIGTTYSWIDCSGGTTITSGDDVEATINWPFSFSFYNNGYTTSDLISVCTNGFIRFDGTANTDANTATNYVLSTGQNTLGQIIALGTYDAKVGDGGGWLRYLVTGSSPNRIFTIEYNNLEIDYNDGNYADIQVSLYETSNIVVLKFGTENIGKNGADLGICSGVTNYYSYWDDINGRTANTWMAFTPPTKYYSFGNAAPNNTANWWTNTDGTGSHPGNFTSNNQVFYIQNGTTYTTTANWTVNGTNTSIIVESGGTLIAANNILGAATFNLQTNANLEIKSNAGITTTGATGSIQVTGTRVYNTGANYTYSYSGAGAQVTGNALTTANNLTANTTNGLTLSNNVTVNGILDYQSGVVTLNGTTLNITGTVTRGGAGTGTITGSTTSSLNITGTGDLGALYFTSGSETIRNLTINRTTSGTATLGTNLTLSTTGILTLTNGNIVTGSNYLAVTNTATTAIAGYSSNSYVYGNLRRTLGATGTYILPIGESASYNAFELVSVTGGATPIIAASVTSSPAATTGDATITTMLPRNWNVQVISGTFTSAQVRLTDATTAGHGIGASSVQAGPYTSVGSAWTAATITTNSTFSNTTLPAYFAIGTPVIPTYYSYQNGNWNTSAVWTLDPSGTTWVNPSGSYPTSSDNAYILNGRTVTATGAVAAKQLSLEDGGILDLVTFSGSFTNVIGSGLIRLNNSVFPTGNFTAFIAAGGGTVEYYNTSNFSFSQLEYNNLIINSNPSATIATIAGNMIVNNDLTITSGNLCLGNSTASRSLTVYGDIALSSSNSQVSVYNANGQHNIYLYGDLSNEGGAFKLHNLSAPNYNSISTTGYANLYFNGGDRDQIVTANGAIEPYRIFVNKGTDQTYMVDVEASGDYFKLYGHTYQTGSIILSNGTLKLGSSITIPQFMNGTVEDYTSATANSQYTIPETACLWIDGADVTSTTISGTNYRGDLIFIYGKLIVSNGSFYENTHRGLILTATGTIQVDGGGLSTSIIRPAYMAGTHRGTYSQSGGTVNVRRDINTARSSLYFYGSFTLVYADNVFMMSGGTLNILNSTPDGTGDGEFSLLLGMNASNVQVTGGEINITVPTDRDAKILSTGPLWNLNIISSSSTYRAYLTNYVGYTGTTYDIDAQPLTVLNNFSISNPAIFDASGEDVAVGGDFTIASGATYTPGTNTTTLNGASGQEFQINGTITGGLNNLTLTNTSATVLTASVQKTLVVNGALTISALCSLEDYGNIINALGTVYNSGTHISNNTGDGKLVLKGTTTQQIQGDGNGIFGNLELNNTFTAGSDAAKFYANQIVTNTLTLTNGILNIDKYKLRLYNNTTSAISVSSPSANKMIKTAGNQSDGGVLKIYDVSPNNTFTFPVGTSTGYSPATITVTATNNGNVIVKPVNVYQPYATYANNPLNKYWKVESEYFSGVTSVTHQYQYVDPGDIQATKTDANFVRAICKNYAWADLSALTAGEKTANQINFTTTYIDGDYTAGDLTAFTPIVTYYSKATGNWSDVTTWSTSSHNAADPDPATPPTSINPVVIGDGATYNHTVTVTGNGAQSGSLQLNTGSVLDLGSTTGHNFGMLPNQVISGAGKLRISSSTATAQFPAGDFGAFIGSSGGTVEYYTSGTSFTLPIISWTTGLSLANYFNLNLMATGANTITLPNSSMTIYNDLTAGSGSYTNNVLLNMTSATSLTINNNLNINDGVLRYQNGFAQNVIVGQNVSIASGATFEVLNSGTTCANTLTISGNLTNDGSLTLLNGTRYCNLTFTGNTDNSFTGTNGSAITTLNSLTINKGTTQSSVLTMDVAGTLTTLSNNWLTLSNGTFRFAVPSKTITLTNTADNSYTIPATACLSVNATSAIIMISNINSNTSDLLLSGKLEVKTGTVNIGRSTMADNNNNDIEYASAGTPEISIETGGILNVNGQIRYSTTSTTGSLIYNQSGGDVTIWGHNQEAARAKLAIHNLQSIFNMSDGTITIKTGGGTTFSDVYIRPDASTVIGGTISFDATTMGNQTYKLDANTPIYNLTLTGAASNTVTLDQTVSTLELLGSLSIDANSTFNTNDLSISIGGNFTKSGVYNYGTNTTTFNGSGDQTITLNNTTFFNKLTINKSSGTVNLLGTNDPTVNGTFSLLDGTFDTKNRNIYLIENVVNSGTHVSTGTGTVFLQGSTKQTISGDGSGSFANITLNNLNGIDLIADLAISKQLNLQNGMFYIDKYLLTFTETAPLPAGYSANKFITTSGVSSDAGIRKMLALGNSSFIFPIGALGSGANKYTPATYTLTGVTGTSPYIQIRPINSRHLATVDAANKELTYYWNVTTSSDFAATALTQVFNYLQSDVQGTESSYLGGRLPYSTVVWQQDGTVDYATNNNITFTNINAISGDYTAGEASEFTTSDLYRARATGNWNNYLIWEKSSDDGAHYSNCTLASEYPKGNHTIIPSAYTVTATANGYSSIYLELYGTMNLGVTNSHNFIALVGNGRLRIDQNTYNAFIFPGGDNSVFMNTTGSTIEYYASSPAILPIIETYQNLELSGSGTKALSNVDLTIKGNLALLSDCGQLSNATYAKNIAIQGNWLNNTTTPFIPGAGTVTFNGTSAQQIAGTGTLADPGETFYNVIINNTGGLSVARNINIKKDLTINSGCSFSGSSYTVSIQGNWNNNSNSNYIVGTSTVNFNGSTSQTFYGASGETFNNLTIGNPTGLTANCNTTITGNIDFTAMADSRKFKIGSNLLTLSSTTGTISNAGTNKFIQTNGLADDAGIIKSLTGSYNFTFPVGVGTKYTPAQFNETGAGGTGTIKVILVNSKHPFANNNLSDELQFYWIVEKGGSLTPTTVTHTYTFATADALPSASGYVSARFYNNQWNPVSGGESGTSVASPTLTFTSKNYLTGEYTCGVSTNFSTVNTYYSRDNATNIATTGADWRDLHTWSTLSHSDNIHIPNTIPNANSVIIKAGHKVVSYDDGINISNLTLNGELQLNATASHTFGGVTGTGKLSLKNNVSNQFVLPTANFATFTSASGGTIEYNGNGDLPGNATYNNLVVTNTGAKNMPNANLTVNGNLQIANGQLNNVYGKDITIKKNWIDNIALGGFSSSAGKVTFSGTVAQTITTNVNGEFYNLEINNSNGLTLQSPVEVNNNLILSNGKIVTASGKELLLSNSNSNIVSGSGLGTTSYVSGPLNKNIAATGNFLFPVGTSTTYHPVTISNADADVWQAQYYLGNYNSSNYVAPIGAVSNAEYWRVKSTTDASQAIISLPYNTSGIISKWVVVEYSAINLWNNDLGSTITTATTSVATNSKATFNISSGVGNYFTVGSTNLIEWLGGISTDWHDINNWSTLTLPVSTDNVKIPVVGGSNFYPVISSGTPTCYNLTNETGATLEIAGSTNLNIYGNWTNNGTFTANSSSMVSFVGSANQNISGNNPSAFYDLTINNTGVAANDLVTLNATTYINNSLTLTDGIISSSPANTLIFNDGATSSVGNQTGPSFVYGPAQKIGNQNFIFPAGDIQGTDYVWEPIGIDNSAGLATDAFTTTYYFTPSSNNDVAHWGTGINHTSFIEMWNVNRDLGTSTPPVTLYWTDGTRSRITDITPGYDLCVAHFDGLSSQWENMGSTSISGDLSSGSITTTVPFTNYSPITFGSLAGVNPLPVSLTNFEASIENKAVNCKWTTQSEINNDYFELQHSGDAINFSKLGIIYGAGNSQRELNYSFVDNNPLSGINYYRLKQVDFDGKSEYSDIISVAIDNIGDKAFQAYPNPTTGKFTVEVATPIQKGTIRIINTKGEIVKKVFIDGAYQTIDISDCIKGTYMLMYSSGTSFYTRKIVKL